MALATFPTDSSPDLWSIPKNWPDNSNLSLWRQPRCIAGLSSSNLEFLQIKRLPTNLRLSQPKAMAVHSSENLVMGSKAFGSDNGDLQFVNHSKDGFRATRKFSLGGGCTSLCWIDDRLLCGTGRSEALFYRLNPDSIPKMLAVTASYSHEKFVNSELTKSNPTSYPICMRLNSVRINPVDKDVFSAVENSRLHLWNLGRSDNPLFSGKITASTIFASEWSPHSASLMLCAGLNQSVRLLDSRQLVKAVDRAVIWKINNAHSGPIKSVSWSPLVSHWIATGSDDGCVNLWDIRLNKGPFCSLRRHTNAVQSLSWSMSHSEILISSANDCSCRIWNLTVAPHYLMNSCHGFESPPMVTAFSASNPALFFTLSSDGDVEAIQMTTEFFRDFVPHHYQEKGLLEHTIEDKLYSRDLESAIALIADKGSQLWKEGRYDKTAQLLSLYSETEFERLLTTLPDSYETLLKHLSYHISPRASKLCDISVATELKLRTLRTRLAIHNAIRNRQQDELLRLENNILSLISGSDDAFDARLLQSMIETIMPVEYTRALKFALRIGECLRDRSRFSDFIGISTLVMSPTIYDPLLDADDFAIAPALVKKANVAIERDLRNPKIVIPQIELLIKVHVAIAKPDASDAILQVMEDQHGSKIFPTALHRIYFNALIQLKHYDKFFILATQLGQQLEGYPFSSILMKLMEEVALPKISSFLSQNCIESARNTGDSNLLVAGALSLVNMTQNCAFVPDFLKDDLPKWILKFCSELDGDLKGLATEDAAIHANKMTEQMNLIRDSKRTGQTFCKDEMATLYSVLKKYGGRGSAAGQGL